MTTWLRWIGLPHRLGADPCDGVGADCLVMCAKVRTDAGLSMPDIDPQWFALAAAKQWEPLTAAWDQLMERCDAEPYALLLHRQPSGLGVAIAIDDGILVVHHRRGVQWLPIAAAARVIRLEYWRPRHAAI